MGTLEDQIKRGVENLHNCSAVLQEVVSVKETFENEVVWEGSVLIFNLNGHPEADKCYAWASPVEGSEKRKFYAVLHIPPVDSPERAIRASIIQDYRKD